MGAVVASTPPGSTKNPSQARQAICNFPMPRPVRFEDRVPFPCSNFAPSRYFSSYYKENQQELRLRTLTTLLWLLLPVLALAAPRGAVPVDVTHRVLLVSRYGCGTQVPANISVRRCPVMRRRVPVDQGDCPHHPRHRRPLAAVADTHAPLLNQQPALARACDRPPFSLPVFLPGRSPPAC